MSEQEIVELINDLRTPYILRKGEEKRKIILGKDTIIKKENENKLTIESGGILFPIKNFGLCIRNPNKQSFVLKNFYVIGKIGFLNKLKHLIVYLLFKKDFDRFKKGEIKNEKKVKSRET